VKKSGVSARLKENILGSTSLNSLSIYGGAMNASDVHKIPAKKTERKGNVKLQNQSSIGLVSG